MATDKSMKIPISEVWKRRLVLISVCSVMLTLVGLVMVAVECTKLQRSVLNSMMYIGFSQAVVGLVSLYVVFGYTVYKHDQYPTGPVIISGHALYFLTGLALILVAFIVPADDMFHFVSFESGSEETRQESSGEAEDSFKEFRGSQRDKRDNLTDIPNTRVGRDTRWTGDMIEVIQTRLSILGGGVAGIGLFGGVIPLVIIYRVHRSIEKRKKRELNRRTRMRALQKALKPKTHDTLKKLNKRDSVYDYAGWGNRTSDIYHGHHKEGRGSATPSMLSAGMISGSVVDMSPDGDVDNVTQWYQRPPKNADFIPKVGTDLTQCRGRDGSDSSPSPTDMTFQKRYHRRRMNNLVGRMQSSTSLEMIQIHSSKKNLNVQNGQMERRHTSPVTLGNVSPCRDSEFSRRRKLASIRQESLSADEISPRSCRNVEKFYENSRGRVGRGRERVNGDKSLSSSRSNKLVGSGSHQETIM